MGVRKTFYLVDVENVGNTWLDILPEVTERDEIVLFYTREINSRVFEQLEKSEFSCTITTIRCYTGKDALDFQLASYLGMMATKRPKSNYIILSHDKGYDPLVHFWFDKGLRIIRAYKAIIIKKKEGEVSANLGEQSEILQYFVRTFGEDVGDKLFKLLYPANLITIKMGEINKIADNNFDMKTAKNIKTYFSQNIGFITKQYPSLLVAHKEERLII